MQELKACCAMVQEISAAGTRTKKNRKASSTASEDASTSARPRSVGFVVVVGDGCDEGVLFTGLKAGGVVLALEL
jgi:hypothetical protein